jgi:hypothetical protein
MSFTESITATVIASVNTKVNSLVNEIASKLLSKYNIPIDEAIQLWNEVNSEFTVKEKIVKPKGEKTTMKNCPYIKKGGNVCDKKCRGDFCSSHLPENIEKKRKKAAESKAKKQVKNEEDMPALEEPTDDEEEIKLPEKLLNWSKKTIKEIQEIDSGSVTLIMDKLNLQKLLKGREISETDELNESGYPVGIKAKEDCIIIAYEDGNEEKTKCKIMSSNLEGEWKDFHSFLFSTK